MPDLAGIADLRPFAPGDAREVRELFIRVNRELAPTALRPQFELYIERSLAEEIDRITAYYAERGGRFWVAETDRRIVGMFGLERSSERAAELRRMYVAPEHRRQGLAPRMLAFAEDAARSMGFDKMVLSTSELQAAAIALYRAHGYALDRQERAIEQTNKMVGGDLMRFYFSKDLGAATVPSSGA
jgi:putative acetyltransferase